MACQLTLGLKLGRGENRYGKDHDEGEHVDL